jgi:hypothetical protein
MEFLSYVDQIRMTILSPLSFPTDWLMPCFKCSYFNSSSHEAIFVVHYLFVQVSYALEKANCFIQNHCHIFERDHLNIFFIHSMWHEDYEKQNKYWISWLPEEILHEISSIYNIKKE